MKYLLLMVSVIVIGQLWYEAAQPVVYACSEPGNPPDVVKQCKSITRWHSWVKK